MVTARSAAQATTRSVAVSMASMTAIVPYRSANFFSKGADVLAASIKVASYLQVDSLLDDHQTLQANSMS
jgi:hypothetical protein